MCKPEKYILIFLTTIRRILGLSPVQGQWVTALLYGTGKYFSSGYGNNGHGLITIKFLG